MINNDKPFSFDDFDKEDNFKEIEDFQEVSPFLSLICLFLFHYF